MKLFEYKKPDSSVWEFHAERVGKKHSIYDCFYCGLLNEKVETGGIYYCPNPHCPGPGGAWFRSTLDSYKELDDGSHTVDGDEWKEKADKYLREQGRVVEPITDEELQKIKDEIPKLIQPEKQLLKLIARIDFEKARADKAEELIIKCMTTLESALKS